MLKFLKLPILEEDWEDEGPPPQSLDTSDFQAIMSCRSSVSDSLSQRCPKLEKRVFRSTPPPKKKKKKYIYINE